MIKLKDINDNNIAESAESLLFYEKYEPILDYLERKKELWLNEDKYLQLNEVPVDYDRNPEFAQFIRYLGENKIDYQADRNNHIRVYSKGKCYVIWSYCTELRIEKWCFEGVPITYYYTDEKRYYCIVANENGKQYKLSGQEALDVVFG